MSRPEQYRTAKEQIFLRSWSPIAQITRSVDRSPWSWYGRRRHVNAVWWMAACRAGNELERQSQRSTHTLAEPQNRPHCWQDRYTCDWNSVGSGSPFRAASGTHKNGFIAWYAATCAVDEIMSERTGQSGTAWSSHPTRSRAFLRAYPNLTMLWNWNIHTALPIPMTLLFQRVVCWLTATPTSQPSATISCWTVLAHFFPSQRRTLGEMGKLQIHDSTPNQSSFGKGGKSGGWEYAFLPTR